MANENKLRIPLAGNAYQTKGTPTSGRVTKTGIGSWNDPDAIFSIYVKFAHPVKAVAALKIRPQDNKSTVSLTYNGLTLTSEIISGANELTFGEIEISEGYQKFDIQGIYREGDIFCFPMELILYGVNDSDIESYISPEEKDNFYWTRRGPSVHCGYKTQDFGDIEWFYNEVTVPEGFDEIGVYAMGVGFKNGYCGIQVNSPSERRILFSIWSPFVTDNPDEIPEEDKVICLGSNPRTRVGEFGGEGSGGQSFIRYKWKAGQKCRILVHVKPTGDDRTVFTAYFWFHDTEKFEMIASFSRPHTNCWLEGPHSFLENFIDTQGYKVRKAYYSNQWARNTHGEWNTPDTIRFTADATARAGWRKDYTGYLAEDNSTFVLHHCGFINDNTEIGTIFNADTSERVLPDDVRDFVDSIEQQEK